MLEALIVIATAVLVPTQAAIGVDFPVGLVLVVTGVEGRLVWLLAGMRRGAGAEGTLAASESTARLAARGGGERLSWLGAKNTDIAGIMAAAAMTAVMKKAFM